VANVQTRLVLREYGKPNDLRHDIGLAIGVDRDTADQILLDAGNRIALNMGLSYNPISIGVDGVKVVDVAGLIRLSPSLELEIVPKFLDSNDPASTWREDFFYLSTLSQYGRLLPVEYLSSSGGTSRDLAALVAHSIVGMYDSNKRRPLRTYRRIREYDFFLDGDIDPIDLIFPSADGFEQERLCFDKHNGWNADIVAAARKLLPELRTPSVLGSLMRMIEDLSPQKSPANRKKPIPSRHHAWKPLHQLSVDVLKGFGLNYQQNNMHAPGYMIVTWRVWEDLLTVAARLGFGNPNVRSQRHFHLGNRINANTRNTSTILVRPDCIIEADGARPRFILDAKYKARVEKGGLHISSNDIYEALAFSKACKCDHVVLAYPALPASKPPPIGSCVVFEEVIVGAVRIIGVHIEIRSVSKKGSINTFADNMKKTITTIL